MVIRLVVSVRVVPMPDFALGASSLSTEWDRTLTVHRKTWGPRWRCRRACRRIDIGKRRGRRPRCMTRGARRTRLGPLWNPPLRHCLVCGGSVRPRLFQVVGIPRQLSFDTFPSPARVNISLFVVGCNLSLTALHHPVGDIAYLAALRI